MHTCGNQECQKEIPENLNFCSEVCLRKHLEQKKKRKAKKQPNLTDEEDIWLGQARRKRAMEVILEFARKTLPLSYEQFVCLVSYRTGISYRKVTDDYLRVLLGVRFLERDGNLLILGSSETEVSLGDEQEDRGLRNL